MSIVFAKEPVTPALLAEAIPLLRAHWKEVAHYEDIPLDVDVDRYLAMEQAGVIRCFTVREKGEWQGMGELYLQRTVELVGYALYFVNYNMHYQTSLQAVQDVLYMDPSHRGKTSYRFIRWCDEQLQSEGVQAVYHHSKAAHDFGKLLQAQGYELVDLIYAKRLDDTRVMGQAFDEQHQVDEMRTANFGEFGNQ